MQTREQEIDEFIHHVKTTGGIAREENDLLDAMGIGRIIPNLPAGEIRDRDLEIAELLAKELTELGILYTAAEMRIIRKWIRDKRLTTMVGINEKL